MTDAALFGLASYANMKRRTELATLPLVQSTREVTLEDNSIHNAQVLSISRPSENGDEPLLLGRIEWEENTGEILHLWVAIDYKRHGLATRLWRAAQEQGAIHSEWRTIEGQKWATSLGDELPEWRLA